MVRISPITEKKKRETETGGHLVNERGKKRNREVEKEKERCKYSLPMYMYTYMQYSGGLTIVLEDNKVDT